MRKILPVVCAVLLVVLVAPPSWAAVSVDKAELKGSTLRVEGRGAVPGGAVTVTSPESTASGTADGAGTFRLESSSFRSSTCRATVADAASSTTVTLSGCSVSSPPPTQPPPPSGTCTIVPTTFPDGNVGTLATWFFSTRDCRTSESPVRFSVVAGQIPPGHPVVHPGCLVRRHHRNTHDAGVVQLHHPRA